MSKSPNIFLFVGEDDYLTDEAAKKVIARAMPAGAAPSAVETVPGDGDNADEQMASLKACSDSIFTPPFLDPVKLTWWRRVKFLPGGGGRTGQVSEAVKAALEDFAARLAAHPPPANQFLVVTAAKLLAASRFAKIFKTLGEVTVFAAGARARDRTGAALANLPDLAAAEGLAFAPGAAEAFVARVGTDTRTLVSELAKLRTYLGDAPAPVTRADIAEISSPGGDAPELWELTDAIAARDPARLLATCARFGGSDKPAILFATVVEKFFRELIVYRDAVDRGWLSEAGWRRDLPEPARRRLDETGLGPGAARNDWSAKRGARAARRFSPAELRVARYRLLQVRERLVSSGDSSTASVVQELLRAIAARR